MKDYDNVSALSRETEGLIFGALAVLTFSFSMVGTRLAAPELGGLFVGLARGLIGAIVAVIVWKWRRYGWPDRADWGGLATIAIGSVFGFPVLSALAMERVPASHGLVFTAVLPLATSAAAVLRAGEQLPRRTWTASIGALILVAGHTLSSGQPSFGRADLLLVLGMLLSAAGYTEGGRLAVRYGGARVITWSLLMCLPVLVPAVAVLVYVRPPEGSAAAWAGLAYVGVGTMYVGFLLWYRGMAAGGVARTAQLQALQPLLGLVWCGLVLREPLSPSLGLTAVGVIALVALGRVPAGATASVGSPGAVGYERPKGRSGSL